MILRSPGTRWLLVWSPSARQERLLLPGRAGGSLSRGRRRRRWKRRGRRDALRLRLSRGILTLAFPDSSVPVCCGQGRHRVPLLGHIWNRDNPTGKTSRLRTESPLLLPTCLPGKLRLWIVQPARALSSRRRALSVCRLRH